MTLPISPAPEGPRPRAIETPRPPAVGFNELLDGPPGAPSGRDGRGAAERGEASDSRPQRADRDTGVEPSANDVPPEVSLTDGSAANAPRRVAAPAVLPNGAPIPFGGPWTGRPGGTPAPSAATVERTEEAPARTVVGDSQSIQPPEREWGAARAERGDIAIPDSPEGPAAAGMAREARTGSVGNAADAFHGPNTASPRAVPLDRPTTARRLHDALPAAARRPVDAVVTAADPARPGDRRAGGWHARAAPSPEGLFRSDLARERVAGPADGEWRMDLTPNAEGGVGEPDPGDRIGRRADASTATPRPAGPAAPARSARGPGFETATVPFDDIQLQGREATSASARPATVPQGASQGTVPGTVAPDRIGLVIASTLLPPRTERLLLVLEPETLGRVEVEIARRAGRVSVELSVESSAAMRALEGERTAIETALRHAAPDAPGIELRLERGDGRARDPHAPPRPTEAKDGDTRQERTEPEGATTSRARTSSNAI